MCFERGVDYRVIKNTLIKKALENVNKAVAENQKAFYMYMLKARIQKDMGDVAGAKTTANKVIELAKEAKNDEYVKMANELVSSR